MRIRKSKVVNDIVTDTIGIPLGVKVTDANISDNQVAIELLTEIFSWQITIQLVCADADYLGKLGDWLSHIRTSAVDLAVRGKQIAACRFWKIDLLES